VCCSVLQYVAVCCSALQCVAGLYESWLTWWFSKTFEGLISRCMMCLSLCKYTNASKTCPDTHYTHIHASCRIWRSHVRCPVTLIIPQKNESCLTWMSHFSKWMSHVSHGRVMSYVEESCPMSCHTDQTEKRSHVSHERVVSDVKEYRVAWSHRMLYLHRSFSAKKALQVVALLRKMICNSRHPMSLCHPLRSHLLSHRSYANTWVMSHVKESCLTWKSHVLYEGVTFHVLSHRSYTHKWVMSHLNESCLTWKSHVLYEGVTFHVLSHRSYTHKWVMSHLNESCLTWKSHVLYEGVTFHVLSRRSYAHN